MRANVGIIGNVGSAYATTLPGEPNARMVASSTSSDPHPVTIVEASTPTYAASARFNSSAYTGGYRVANASCASLTARIADGAAPHWLVLSERSIAQGARFGAYRDTSAIRLVIFMMPLAKLAPPTRGHTASPHR